MARAQAAPQKGRVLSDLAPAGLALKAWAVIGFGVLLLAAPAGSNSLRLLGALVLAAGLGLLLMQRRQGVSAPEPASTLDAGPAPRPERWDALALDRLSVAGFEAVTERLWQQEQRVHVLSRGESGLWLELFDATALGRPTAIALCRHGSAPVKVAEVQELAERMARRGVPQGHFVTSARFTDEARRCAQGHRIRTTDRAALLAQIGSRTPAQQRELLALGWPQD